MQPRSNEVRTHLEMPSAVGPPQNEEGKVFNFLTFFPAISVSRLLSLMQIDSPEKWRESMEMALEMFKAQKAMLKQDGGGGDAGEGIADVDDLDDD